MTKIDLHRLKKLTLGSPIKEAPLPNKVYIPLEVSSNPKISVKIGDRVKTGTVIGQQGGEFILSSITGEVVALQNFPHPLRREAQAITIQSSGKERWETLSQLDSLNFQELLSTVSKAGINLPKEFILKRVDGSPLIINGADEDPFTFRDRLIEEQGEEILSALNFLKKILKIKEAKLIIREHKRKSLKEFKRRAQEKGIKVIKDKRRFPIVGTLFLDRGFSLNLETVLAIREAIIFGRPCIETYVTVTGRGINEPQNLKVRIGTPLRDIIQVCGGFRGKLGKIVFGGPLTGRAQFDLNVPILLGTKGIIFFSKEEVNPLKIGVCFRCGKCVEICPAGLFPYELGNLIEHDLSERTELLGINDCLECGLCAYVCPTKRELLLIILIGKAMSTVSNQSGF